MCIVKLRKIGEAVALTGPNKELLDDGIASLALAETAIARIKDPLLPEPSLSIGRTKSCVLYRGFCMSAFARADPVGDSRDGSMQGNDLSSCKRRM
jgi:hypothetical protein